MKKHADYLKAVQRLKWLIDAGKVIVIDPSSSSNLGWAFFYRGQLVDSGSYTHNGTTVYTRLHKLAEFLRTDGRFLYPDVVVIEKLYRSRTTPTHLLWSIGTILASLNHKGNVVECPITLWRGIADARHLKLKKSKIATDKMDAEAMGRCVIQTAKEMINGGTQETTNNGTKRKSVSRTNPKRADVGDGQEGTAKTGRRSSRVSKKAVGSGG